MPETRYACDNKGCALGAQGQTGHFTSGMTEKQFIMLTGNPNGEEGVHFGEGICPNCGTKGKKDGTHESAVGSDPHEEAHAAIAARVEDDKDELTAEDAQAALHELIGVEHEKA